MGEAPAEEASGTFSPEAGKVAIRDPDGTVWNIPAGQLGAAVNEGARPATETEWQNAKLGKPGEAASAAIGAGQGLSFGYALPALVAGAHAVGADETAEDFRKGAQIAKATSPHAMLGGEIAGSLAGMALVPGGAGGGATAETALGRGLQRFGAAAPRAAVEGAILGVGQQATEDTLGNHDATAEKYLLAGGKGLVFGGLLGGGLHATSGALGDKLTGFYGRSAEGADALATREVAGGPYRTAAREAETVADREAEGGSLEWLRGTAEEKAFKATGAKIRDFQKLGATAEQQAERSQRIGRTLLDEGIVTATASQEKIAQRLTAKTRQVGEELSALRSKLDTAAARPSTEAIANRVMEEVLVPLEKLPGTQAEARAVREYVSDFLEKAGPSPSFETLHTFRRALDDKLNPKLWSKLPGTAPPAAEELGRVRGIIEDEFTTAGERAANEIGDTFAAKYKLTKQLYGDLRTAEKIATKEVARGGANRSISLTDTIVGGAGLVAGGPMGLAAAIGNKALRTYGDQFTAHVLDKASRLQGVQRASQSVDDAIRGSVKGFLGGERAATHAAERVTPKVTDETVAEIREMARDPQALTAHVAKLLDGAGLRDAAPKVSQAAATTLMRAATYLQSKAPKEPPPSGVSFVKQAPRPMSHSERATFADAVDAVNDPIGVIDDLRHGRVSREQVEAIRIVYPQLYAQVQKEIAAQAVQLRPTLTTQQEIALSVLFDVPVSELMKSDTITAFQKSFAKDVTQDPANSTNATPKPMQFERERGSMASGFDRQEGAA